MEDQEQIRLEILPKILNLWCNDTDGVLTDIYFGEEESTRSGYDQAKYYVELLLFLEGKDLKFLYNTMVATYEDYYKNRL